MTEQEHRFMMGKQEEKYRERLRQNDITIADLRCELNQYRMAVSAFGWLIQQALKNPSVEP